VGVCRGTVKISGTPHDAYQWRPGPVQGVDGRAIGGPCFRDELPTTAITHFTVTCFRVFAPSLAEYRRREDEFVAAAAGGGAAAPRVELAADDPHPIARMLQRDDDLCNMCEEVPFAVIFRSCPCACLCVSCEVECVRVHGPICPFCRVSLAGRHVVQ